MGNNIAFKCTFNNGNTDHYLGYNGTCSEDIIKYNITSKRIWCSNQNCDCYKYYENGFKGAKPKFPCMESKLFNSWEFGAGVYHHGKREGKTIKFSNIDKNKIAFLTTRYPGDKEIDRKIFGLFKISKVSDDITTIYADNFSRIPIPKEEVDCLYFWDYFTTIDGAKWKSGLFRYIDDEVTINILSDLFLTIKDEIVKEKLYGLLINTFNLNNIPLPKRIGPHSKVTGDRIKKVFLNRKYGMSGEGPEHYNLKMYIAKNPNILGISNVKNTHIEYLFPSGDMVDILFETENGQDVVVEIETYITMPGCYQAIKYRSLRCAQKMIDLNSPLVKAIVVAWNFNDSEKEFCLKYDITHKIYKI